MLTHGLDAVLSTGPGAAAGTIHVAGVAAASAALPDKTCGDPSQYVYSMAVDQPVVVDFNADAADAVAVATGIVLVPGFPMVIDVSGASLTHYIRATGTIGLVKNRSLENST